MSCPREKDHRAIVSTCHILESRRTSARPVLETSMVGSCASRPREKRGLVCVMVERKGPPRHWWWLEGDATLPYPHTCCGKRTYCNGGGGRMGGAIRLLDPPLKSGESMKSKEEKSGGFRPLSYTSTGFRSG